MSDDLSYHRWIGQEGENPHRFSPRANGSIELLESTGVLVGPLPIAPYFGADTNLSEGDLLMLYTDGITEVADPDEEEFGLERLEAVCRSAGSSDLEEISNEVDKAITEFPRGEPFAGDRTLILLRRYVF